MPATPPVDAVRLASLLGPGSMWGPIEVTSSTGSTNADLAGRPAGQVLIADHQTGGRGRFDRAWVDVPGTAVAVSCVVRPAHPKSRWGWLSLVAGIAVVEGLRDMCGEGTADPGRIGLKWPNDVLVDGAKVCGILCQTAGETVVIGWGVNVSMAADELPAPGAMSLRLAGMTEDKTALVASVLTSLQRHYALWQAGSVTDAYRRVSATLGRPVRVLLAGGSVDPPGTCSVEGTAVDVDDSGALLVDVPGAGVRAFPAGDVVHLRGFGAGW